MENLIFKPVDFNQNSRKTGKPTASISKNRISLNSEACALVDNIYTYDYAEVLSAQNKNEHTIIALRFTNEKKSNTVKSTRVKFKGNFIEGINLNSKDLVGKLFGTTLMTSTKRFLVEKDDKVTLLINTHRTNEI